ncbi:MAG: hypothetical protein JWQ38_645 [Flavipsychrobacter sp.]|nr:hypothetical protein [Flavipsychrobacter sp.]
MGLFYEGAFFQTKNKDEVKAAYDKYSALMSDCFTAKGYTIHQQNNFTPEVKSYQKLVFMAPEQDAAGGPPAHATMETMYNKQVGLYTIVMYIFEH